MAVAQVEEIINKMQKEKIEVENREAHSCLEEHVVEPTSSMTDRPLFVTWKITRADGRKNLRGCIGTFQPLAVEKGLRNYAKIAAFNDNRFDPIAANELPLLECGVTLLSDFEPVPHALDWTLGVHGIQISFWHNGQSMSGTYLPEVPVEQGWTKEETMWNLMWKAGWDGPQSEWQKVDLQVIRYQGSKAKATWEEYLEMMAIAVKDGCVRVR